MKLPRPSWPLLGLAFAFTAAVGIAKVLWQRTHPPAWATLAPGHRFEDFLSIDGYSHRIAVIADWLASPGEKWPVLRAYLAADQHQTTMTVPTLAAMVSRLTGSIPWSFVAVNLALCALSIALAMRLAAACCAPDTPAPLRSRIALQTGLVLALHCLTARTAALLIVDQGVVLAAVGTLLALCRWLETRSLRAMALASAGLTFGLFSKVNFLPFLAAPTIAAWLARDHRGQRLVVAAVATAVPVLLAIGWTQLVAGQHPLPHDVRHLLTTTKVTSSSALRFALEMVLLVQIAILLRPQPSAVASSRGAKLVATTAGLYLLATAGFKLPTIPRLYLPFLFLMAPWLLARRGGDLPSWAILMFLIVNPLIAIAGVFLA
jgi:hypothetical protein